MVIFLVLSTNPDSFLFFDETKKLATLPLGAFCFVNTSNRGEIGKHWLSIIRVPLGYEILDSSGCGLEIAKKLKLKGKISCNSDVLQSHESEICAHLAMLYTVHRLYCFDEPMEEVLNEILTSDPKTNEEIAEIFISTRSLDTLSDVAAEN